MARAFVVTEPFERFGQAFERGHRIEDTVLVEAIEDSEYRQHVVAVTVPDEPAPKDPPK